MSFGSNQVSVVESEGILRVKDGIEIATVMKCSEAEYDINMKLPKIERQRIIRVDDHELVEENLDDGFRTTGTKAGR